MLTSIKHILLLLLFLVAVVVHAICFSLFVLVQNSLLPFMYRRKKERKKERKLPYNKSQRGSSLEILDAIDFQCMKKIKKEKAKHLNVFACAFCVLKNLTHIWNSMWVNKCTDFFSPF